MKVKNEAPEYELLEEDTYPARCVGIYDLGRQDMGFGITHMIWLSFEVIDEEKADGTPFILGRMLSLKFSSRSDLGKILKRWLGIVVARDEVFDFEELLDQPAYITVEHSEENDDGNVYANITQIGKVPKGVKVGKATSDPVLFSLDDFDEDVFDDLPEFLQKRIKASEEWDELFGKGKKGKKSKRSRDDDDEEPRGKKKTSKRSRDDEDEEDEDEQPRRSKRSRKDADDEDEDEAPRKRKSKVKEEEEEEEEDADEEDEQPRKRSTKKPAKKLPKRKR